MERIAALLVGLGGTFAALALAPGLVSVRPAPAEPVPPVAIERPALDEAAAVEAAPESEPGDPSEAADQLTRPTMNPR